MYSNFAKLHLTILGHSTVQLVEVLCYCPEDCGFDSRRGLWIRSSPKSSNNTVALGSTQFSTELITRNLPRDKWRPVRMAHNLTVIPDPLL
jgi:hypothetical protein